MQGRVKFHSCLAHCVAPRPSATWRNALNKRTLLIGFLFAFVLPGWTLGEETDVSARVKKIIVRRLGGDPNRVRESASFIDALGADSLDTVELVREFEKEFGCEIPDDVAESMLTVGDAIKFFATCRPQPRARRLIHRKPKTR